MHPEPDHHQLETDKPQGNKAAMLLFPAIVLVAGLIIAFWLIQTGPKAKPRPKVRNALMVEVRPVEFGPQTTKVSIMGTVKPRHEVELKPEVSGKIISTGQQFIPGGFFEKGEIILAIDPRDYELSIRQLGSDVAKAEADLQLELGRQKVARKEYELLNEDVSAEELELMLRGPQLESTRAALEGTRIRLEQAQLDLKRTVIKAPFNAIVLTRDVNLGTSVSTSTTLAKLVGTNAYWVEASIPASQLKWIEPGNHSRGSSKARIFDISSWGPDLFRKGQTAGLTAKVEDQGRMAEIMVEVPDPLALRQESSDMPQLLLGSYVRVEIEGKTLPEAAAIERELIRDGDRIWIMDENDQLDIRPVEIAFRSHDQVFVTGGIKPGERLVASNLPSPVQGMDLRLSEEPASSAGSGEQQ